MTDECYACKFRFLAPVASITSATSSIVAGQLLVTVTGTGFGTDTAFAFIDRVS